jgi:hypothetical protein
LNIWLSLAVVVLLWVAVEQVVIELLIISQVSSRPITQSPLAVVVLVAHIRAVRVEHPVVILCLAQLRRPAVEAVAKAIKTVLLVAPAAVVVVMAAAHRQVEQPRRRVKVTPEAVTVVLLVRHSRVAVVVEQEQTVVTQLLTTSPEMVVTV